MQYLLMLLLFVVASFLIILVLIQRGRGGGLAGAFGGMGGQSAFGTKAGDLFTKITIGAAAVWILLCMATIKYLGASGDILDRVGGPPASATGSQPAGGAPAGGPASGGPPAAAPESQPPGPPAAGATPAAAPASTAPAGDAGASATPDGSGESITKASITPAPAESKSSEAPANP